MQEEAFNKLIIELAEKYCKEPAEFINIFQYVLLETVPYDGLGRLFFYIGQKIFRISIF